ncbi:collagen alpha-1(I) chain-like [Amphibalanus amphitrite]|uniref:collagen alpha-1(I) chain-like n=1 Tax=Amphibalanus amphitrite TaxID=1232801 RepID=UPI001C90A8EC|nr:collagen alpha-1(I) chain-like [Amphibalanus amphitrite]
MSSRRPLSQYELYAPPPLDQLSHYAYPDHSATFGKLTGKPEPAAYQPAPLQFVQYGAPLLGQSVGSHLLGQHLLHSQQPAATGLYNGPQAAYFQGIPPPEPHLQSFGGLQSFSGLQQLRTAVAASAPWRTADAAAAVAAAAAPGAGSRSPSSAGTPSPSPAAGVQPYPPPPGTRGPARPPEAPLYQSPIRRPVPLQVGGVPPPGTAGRPNPSSAQQQKMREAALHQAQNFFRAGQQGAPVGPMAGSRPPDGVGDVGAAFARADDGSGGDRAARAAGRYRRDQARPGPGGPPPERRDQQR